jgi:phosphatidylinositol glycan class O
MMSSLSFYSSGHQATIPSIRFEAAFVGLPGDMESFYLPGILILLNTFASDVVFTIALPLVIFWRKQSSRHETAEENDRSPTGEFVYHENPTTLRSDLYRACAMYQVCKGLKVSFLPILSYLSAGLFFASLKFAGGMNVSKQ